MESIVKVYKTKNYTLLVLSDQVRFLERTVFGQVLTIEAQYARPQYHSFQRNMRLMVASERLDACRRKETKTNKIGLRLTGGVYETEGQIVRKFRTIKLDRLNTEKKPKSWAFHVGVEIEFVSSEDQRDIKSKLINAGLERDVNLTTDGSVHGESNGENCNGDCRDNCECAYCGDKHYCEDETDCDKRRSEFEGRGTSSAWIIKDDCDCGGQDEIDSETVDVCMGHCKGHKCLGYEDHNDYDCNCECNCGSSEDGHELRAIGTVSKINTVIDKTCAVLREVGADVNKTCGLHVHLDMRRGNAEKAFQNLVLMQPLLYAMNPSSRFKNSFCKPTRGLILNTNADRYRGINGAAMERHETIEVRIHTGSVNASKIKSWVALLVAIVNAPIKLSTTPKTKKQLREWLKITPELMEYIYERVQKFAPEHGKATLEYAKNSRIPSKFKAIDLTQAA